MFDKATNKAVSCTCTKSNCSKNYCDCFKVGSLCSDQCRCIDCKNNKSSKKSINANKNSIEFIRVEIKLQDMSVKEGKIIFNKIPTAKTLNSESDFSALKKKRLLPE